MLDILGIAVSVFVFIVDSFKLWLNNIFITPFSNYALLKILIPVYIGLFVTEFFQEKWKTSMGNAMSNAVIVLWGGVDFTVMTLKNGFENSEIPKILIASVIVLYGLYIIIEGFLGSEIIKYLGRVREVSYFIIIFAPLYYTDIPLSFAYIFSAVAFFYIYYLAISNISKVVPAPQALNDDIKEASEVKLPDDIKK